MKIFAPRLAIIDGTLHGRKLFSDYKIIEPKEIINVREYGCNSPFLEVRTRNAKFRISAVRSTYDEIVSFLEDNTSFKIKDKFIFKWNRLIYRRHFHLFGSPPNSIEKQTRKAEGLR